MLQLLHNRITPSCRKSFQVSDDSCPPTTWVYQPCQIITSLLINWSQNILFFLYNKIIDCWKRSFVCTLGGRGSMNHYEQSITQSVPHILFNSIKVTLLVMATTSKSFKHLCLGNCGHGTQTKTFCCSYKVSRSDRQVSLTHKSVREWRYYDVPKTRNECSVLAQILCFCFTQPQCPGGLMSFNYQIVDGNNPKCSSINIFNMERRE